MLFGSQYRIDTHTTFPVKQGIRVGKVADETGVIEENISNVHQRSRYDYLNESR